MYGQNENAKIAKFYADGNFKKVLEISESKLDKYTFHNKNDSIFFISYLSYKGLAYLELDDFTNAETSLKSALSNAKDFKNITNVITAGPHSNLGMYYYKTGNIKTAQVHFYKALEIVRTELGVECTQYYTIIGNLAGIYHDLNQFSKAEEYYLQVVEGTKKTEGIDSYAYGLSLNNLGAFYIDIDNYKKAYNVFVEAFSIISTDHPNYLLLLNNYAMCVDYLGDDIMAEKLYLHVIDTCIETDQFPGIYSKTLNNLALLYLEQKKYKKAKPLFMKTLVSKGFLYGNTSLEYAITLGNLGLLYERIDEYSNAENTYLKTLTIFEKKLDFKSNYYKGIIENLALLYINKRKIEKAERLLLTSTLLSNRSFLEKNNFLSVKEYTHFKKINLNPHFLTLSFLNDYSLNDSLVQLNYQKELIIKNLSLRNQQRIKTTILKSKDSSLINLYDRFIDNKKQLAKWNELPKEKKPAIYNDYVNNTEEIEKELTRKSSEFAESKKALAVDWKQVQEKLKPNELIIELVAFDYYHKKWTDSIMYSAFLIGKDYKTPKYISLFEQQRLASLLEKKDTPQSSINEQYTSQAISDLFLKPLSKELEGITTIYISPSGLGHQIDFAALPISKNETLGEKFKVHVLGSSANLINYDSTTFQQHQNLELLLYGDIDYDKQNITTSKVNDSISDDTETQITVLASRSGISKWGYLAGTEKEVNTIKIQSDTNRFKARIINGEQATKSSILKLDGKTIPFVLHLATHGYFFENPKKTLPKQGNILTDNNSFGTTKASLYKASDDPMLRSGLLFAGANKYWGKPIIKGTIDDGILTAKTISNLDLSACKLVVLSACETGLGDIKGSEGVFGLQRAFKMAGVKTL